MSQRGGGSIVNIGSIEGLSANPEHAAYCASKAGVHGLTRALAVDLGREGGRCNAIAPGWIDSDLSNAYIEAQHDPIGARRGAAGHAPGRPHRHAAGCRRGGGVPRLRGGGVDHRSGAGGRW
ncbi:SDR family NAD(P)-dependent oxidoreductase [Pseudomonas sp. PL-6]